MKTVLILLSYLHFFGNIAGLEMTSYRFLKRECFSFNTLSVGAHELLNFIYETPSNNLNIRPLRFLAEIGVN